MRTPDSDLAGTILVSPSGAASETPRADRARGADWLVRRRLDPLVTTAGALAATTATTAGLGVAFWAVASHLYSPARLGEDAAAISAMMLLSIVSQLNLGMGISRLLPQIGNRAWRPVLGSYALAGVVAVVASACFVLGAPRVSSSFAFLGHDPRLAVALVLGVVLWNVFALQDAVLTSARWAALLPIENGIFGVLKLGLMVVLAALFVGHGIFYAWLLGMALMLIPVNWIIFGKVLPARHPTRARPAGDGALRVSDRRRVMRYLLSDYVAALLSQGYKALLPLLVLGTLGSSANAYFYAAFLVAAAVGELAQSLSTSLVVEGAHGEPGARLARRSLLLYAKYVVPGVLGLIAAAPLILRPFGSAYETHGTTLLRLLIAGTVPQAVVTLYLGVERLRARVGRVILAEAAVVGFVTCGALVGTRWYGLTGMGLAWLVGQSLVAVAVAPLLWRACGPPTDERLGAHR